MPNILPAPNNLSVSRVLAAFSTLILSLASSACGASSYSAERQPPGQHLASYDSPAQPEYSVESAPYRQSRSSAPQAAPMAMARPMPAPAPESPMADAMFAEAPAAQMTDAVEGQLLVYTGSVTLAAFEIAQTLEEAIALVEENGGHVQRRSRQQVTLRIPAALFRSVLDELLELGDVIDAQWHSEDVSEQFRDTQTRLRNAIASRDRILALLERADSVEDVLAIENQLQRLTLEIELATGQLRAMTDRIQLSTLTLMVRQRSSVDPPSAVAKLPFPWLQNMGLSDLLNL